jgi:hypothetical protein
MVAMSDEPKPSLHRWIVRAGWSVGLSAALYAASFGPAWGLCWRGWISPGTFLVAYRPMITIQRAGGPAGRALHWYRGRFGPPDAWHSGGWIISSP